MNLLFKKMEICMYVCQYPGHLECPVSVPDVLAVHTEAVYLGHIRIINARNVYLFYYFFAMF